jgi:glycosyltransferase involved in cell wall biosynthesis
MHHIPTTPPIVRPLAPFADRPLWSVMIPVYNCAHYLPETLRSVLMQDIPEKDMQIEVVDDASTDTDVEVLVNSIGRGRVRYFRQEKNVGSLINFATCINRSKGQLVHLLHGDDKVRPGYYKEIEQLFKNFPEAGAAFSRYRCIDENGGRLHDKSPEILQEGILENWLLAIAERQRIQYASISVRREVYETLGAFYGLTYGEDWEMWVRIARHYPVAYTPSLLAEYRMHTKSISGSKYLTGEYLKDLSHAMMLIQEHLPEEEKNRILNKSRKYYASYGLDVAKKLWHKLYNRKVVDAQVKQALNMYRSPRFYCLIALLYIKMILRRV